MIQTAKKSELEQADTVLSAFDQLEQRLDRASPAWVRVVRKAAISHFAELGFPTTKHEEWKYTNIAPVAELPFRPAGPPAPGSITSDRIENLTFPGLRGLRLVFINGHFAPDLSSAVPPANGLQAGSLATALNGGVSGLEKHLARYARYNENAFVALNTAFFQDGACIIIPAQQVLDEPIHLLFVATADEGETTACPRNLIIAQKESQAKIIENYVSLADAAQVTNAVTELVLEAGARIEHCKIQNESFNASHIATIEAHLGRNCQLLSHSVSKGARLARNNINVMLDAEGIDATLNGLYLAKAEQLVDHHTAICHAQPHCQSHEHYHGVLDGHAQGVFNGKIFVRPPAQKTDAKQTNRNLLLSPEAAINTKPQLEIFADDVKCTHGATVGQLDEEALFYLRTRGIGLEAARQMLIWAFARDILDRITIEPVRMHLDHLLLRWFARKVKKNS
ncbi:MAG: Fe-S cluster assembly protein SufD [Chloroflexi bacterium]|nr:Fe-S cluster assembly protein SufD [Chloroflexota bacterium]